MKEKRKKEKEKRVRERERERERESLTSKPPQLLINVRVSFYELHDVSSHLHKKISPGAYEVCIWYCRFDSS